MLEVYSIHHEHNANGALSGYTFNVINMGLYADRNICLLERHLVILPKDENGVRFYKKHEVESSLSVGYIEALERRFSADRITR